MGEAAKDDRKNKAHDILIGKYGDASGNDTFITQHGRSIVDYFGIRELGTRQRLLG